MRTILTAQIEGIRIVGEARTGAEALQLIDHCDIDLMLVDINIPKLNGLEVIRYLRRSHPDTKVIITTAYDDFEMTRTAIHLKADEYLLKPIRTEILVATVQSCIQQLGAGRRSRQVVHRIDDLLEQDAYREAIALVRQHTEWIYTQRECPPRELIVDFAAALTKLAQEKGLHIPDRLAEQVAQLPTAKLDDRDRQQVLSTVMGLADLLFDGASERFGYSSDTVQKVLNYIERNLSKGVTLEEVAEYANISSCYLSRLFKKTLNINFVTYLTNRRIALAKEMLTGTELPITNIALGLSYNGINYFCKSFKKEVGLSPSEYRQQFRPEQGAMLPQ
ncbi:response regulator [Telmatospirillum sp.]|uniref:response regulator transcription factor n=1 Tax=Telmatospirillum sp. TaxID=2079197 RepID=UPI002846370D|nr:response regulator [Telmatospirillum sp.]MDR3438603.1 response regulator [Telmatospirillum sp.]